MKKRSYIYQLAFILFAFSTWTFFFQSCEKQNPFNLIGSIDFFQNPKYLSDTFVQFSINSPDSCVQFIKKEIPPRLYLLAYERCFYQLREGTPDSFRFKLIDAFDKNIHNDSIKAFSQLERGNLFINLVKFDTAKKCLDDCYNLSMYEGRIMRAGDAQRLLGRLALRQNNFPEAIHLIIETVKKYNTIDPSLDAGRSFEIMLDLGNAYRGAKDFSEAHVWFQRAWQFAAQRNWAKGFKALSAALVAQNDLELGRIDSAKIMIDTAFYFQKLYQYNYNEGARYYIRGQIEVAQGQCRNALSDFFEALQRNKEKTNQIVINRYIKGLADGYYCLGQLDSAGYLYEKAVNTPDSANQSVIREQLSKLYAQQGNYALALKNEIESRKIYEHIFTTDKEKQIGEIQIQAEADKLIVNSNNAERIWRFKAIIGLISLILAFLTSMFFVYRQRQLKLNARQENKINLIREKLQAQALQLAKTELITKEQELDQSIKLNELKNLIIAELQLKLSEQTAKEVTNQGLTTSDAVSITPSIKQANLKILTPSDWEKFRQLFDAQFPNFTEQLKLQFIKLTNAEIRLFLLIKTGFDALEISNVLGISPPSVYTSRYRLRKKLGLMNDSDDLEGFIKAF